MMGEQRTALVDPRDQATSYLEEHRIGQLFEVLTAQLLFHKPSNPKRFIMKYLEEAKVAGTPPLLTADDLGTMFGMFDVTKRGAMTAEQVNNAQRSILGPSADLAGLGLLADAPMGEPQFVQHMLKALQTAGVPSRAAP